MKGMPLIGWLLSILFVLGGCATFLKARDLGRFNASMYRRVGLRGFADWLEQNERPILWWSRFCAVLLVLMGLFVVLFVPDW